MNEKMFQHRLNELANLTGMTLTYQIRTARVQGYEHGTRIMKTVDLQVENEHREMQTIFTGSMEHAYTVLESNIEFYRIKQMREDLIKVVKTMQKDLHSVSCTNSYEVKK